MSAFVLALFGASFFCLGADREIPPPDYFVGKYEVIGRKPDLKTTYSGSIELRAKSDGNLALIRRVGGHEMKGEAKIDRADPPADHPAVLRIRFRENGREFEGTFLWRSDLDNYPRLSGFISERGKTNSVGLEAWFAKAAWPR